MPAMALPSVSSITHLLHSSSRSPAQPPSLRGNGLFFVDFVGLYCKSKRTRRKFGATISRTLTLSVPNSTSSVKAVLDLQRTSVSSDESPAHPDFKPQVWFSFADAPCFGFFKFFERNCHADSRRYCFLSSILNNE